MVALRGPVRLIVGALVVIGAGALALLALDGGGTESRASVDAQTVANATTQLAGGPATAALTSRHESDAEAARAAEAASSAAGADGVQPVISNPPVISEPPANDAAQPGKAPPAPAPAPSVPTASHSAARAAAQVAADQPLVIKRILPINGPIRYGEWHWDEAGVPPGPLVITVDLKARVLSAFRGGYEIGATAVLVGAPGKPTPTGVFPITEKQVRHFSSLYGEAPMPYMQRLTNDGVTLHASNVRNGYASHGCVGMPLGFARKLFGVTHLGDRVIITDGKRASLGDPLLN